MVRRQVFTRANRWMTNCSTPYSNLQDTLKRYKEGKPEEEQPPMIFFHGLCHILIANHADIRTVQNRLGHAEASATLNIYAHSLQESDQKAAALLENAPVRQMQKAKNSRSGRQKPDSPEQRKNIRIFSKR